jgi:CRP-like cAMP-binding protein/tRNA A-37 threonylcarbamoyl transferase component Bud32
MAKDGSEDRSPVTVVDPHVRARVSAVRPITLPNGRFDDEGELARGGAGLVHTIVDKTLLRRCAMKVLAPKAQAEPTQRQRFVEEAQITAQLDHPNVVPIHELGVSSERSLYFTMKLVEGETLAALIDARFEEVRQVDWVAGFLEILIKVCDGIAFAHSRGVIHRDVKPSNIMVGAFGQVYVMDWGIARLLEGHNELSVQRDPDRQPIDKQGDWLGTAEYMSPEQARGEHEATDERSDIFSLGATLYHIMTGEPPYDQDEYFVRMRAARECVIKPPEEMPLAARLPRGLSRIAMKAMARDPADRYKSVLALKNDLVAQLRGGQNLPRRTFAAGEVVMQQGEVGDAAYIIVQGTCRAYKMVDGEVVELRRMGPGEVFGEAAVLSARPRTASVQALEALTVQVVTSEELEEGVGMNTWLGPFVRTLAERFIEIDDRLTQLEANAHDKTAPVPK